MLSDYYRGIKKKKGNRIPDKSNIVRWISHIKSKASPDDLFIFFFSGHGIDMEKESYLLTIESDPYSEDTLDMSGLKVSDLKRIVEGMTVSRVLFFVDACRNDPRAGKGKADNPLTTRQSKDLVIKPGSRGGTGNDGFFSYTFFSCNVGQRSYEWSEKEMGFFTYYLVKGLRGDRAACAAQGNVTIGSLRKYLGSEVMDAVQRERGAEAKQEPWVSGNASASSGTKSTNHTSPDTTGGSGERRESREDEAISFCGSAEKSFKKGEYDRAILQYSQAISLVPGNAETYCQRARVYDEMNEPEKAISDCNKAMELKPGLALAYTVRATVKCTMRQYDGSISDATKAIEPDPNSSEAYGIRGVCYSQKFDYDRALSDCEKALGLAPRSADAYFARAVVHASMLEIDKAFADCSTAISLNPEFALAYASRGLCRKENDYDNAISDVNKALSINPNLAQAYNNRGLLYLSKGDHERAISELTTSIKLDHLYSDAYANRGLAYYRKGDFVQALSDYNRAIEIAPHGIGREIYTHFFVLLGLRMALWPGPPLP